MRRVTAALTTAAALVLLLAACSSGESDDEATTFDGSTSAESAAPAPAAVQALRVAGGGAGGDVASADLLGRTIIRNGSLNLEVQSVEQAFARVTAIAGEQGGFVANSTLERGGGDGYRYAHLTLRIPAERFDQTIEALRAIAGEVLHVSTSSQDVTGEVTDLEAGLRNLRSVEAQYLTLLTNAKEISDILQVQDRLTETRGQIERTEGRLALLESLADLSTLSVDLNQTPPGPADGDGRSSPLDAAGEAWDASLETLNVIATAAVVVVVYSWWLLPIVILGALALWRWAPRRRRAARRDSDVE